MFDETRNLVCSLPTYTAVCVVEPKARRVSRRNRLGWDSKPRRPVSVGMPLHQQATTQICREIKRLEDALSRANLGITRLNEEARDRFA